MKYDALISELKQAIPAIVVFHQRFPAFVSGDNLNRNINKDSESPVPVQTAEEKRLLDFYNKTMATRIIFQQGIPVKPGEKTKSEETSNELPETLIYSTDHEYNLTSAKIIKKLALLEISEGISKEKRVVVPKVRSNYAHFYEDAYFLESLIKSNCIVISYNWDENVISIINMPQDMIPFVNAYLSGNEYCYSVSSRCMKHNASVEDIVPHYIKELEKELSILLTKYCRILIDKSIADGTSVTDSALSREERADRTRYESKSFLNKIRVKGVLKALQIMDGTFTHHFPADIDCYKPRNFISFLTGNRYDEGLTYRVGLERKVAHILKKHGIHNTDNINSLISRLQVVVNCSRYGDGSHNFNFINAMECRDVYLHDEYWNAKEFSKYANRMTIPCNLNILHGVCMNMKRAGHKKCFLKHTKPKYGTWIIDFDGVDNLVDMHKRIIDTIGLMAFCEVSGFNKSSFIVQPFINFHNEMRFFIVNGEILKAVPVRRMDTVFDDDNLTISDYTCEKHDGHQRVYDPAKTRAYFEMVKGMLEDEKYSAVLDVGEDEHGNIYPIEINSLMLAGRYGYRGDDLYPALIQKTLPEDAKIVRYIDELLHEDD